ncbi:ABC transporter ATP-binding protein [Staphylococcus americanisciuri]|uniref:ABC transporter ATP-binding protein n=1 Tax=Staphylococcus americanisciuri TaxID=2973940 RepID=A0ABT2F330_9STAP|nr:ABC transporter ATP-binding protein [Staphylococcus americanisciuri]MCS4486252.1 ABC transporter ATP-binding protein [Staphylococcus americanisciuri]
MIELENICKTYGEGNTEIQVLKGITLTVSEGEFISIMGTSGCGKSTLINIIGLLDSDFKGKYQLKGESILKLDEQTLASYRNEYIGFIFQNFNLIDEYTVRENILLPFLYSDQSHDESYINNLVKELGLEDKMDDYPCNLSGGQKQRVAIIRAMAHKPQFLIADEPTGSLDETSRNEILRILKNLNQDGTTIIVVTHDIFVARFSDKLYEMRNGYLTLKGDYSDEI